MNAKQGLLITLPIVFVVLMITVLPKILENQRNPQQVVTNFEQCVAAGNPVMESYPRQCRHQDQTFVEDIDGDTEPIPITTRLTESEALAIAGRTAQCTEVGIPAISATYNPNSQTWWVDLERMPELENDGCNPACVIYEQNQSPKVNWRCTGANLPPSENISPTINPSPTATGSAAIKCQPEQRKVDACTQIYDPVCGLVQVECVKAPCDPVKETFSNSCFACMNERVISYTEGECAN